MFFNNLNSTALDEIEVNDNKVRLVYKSSGISYHFEIKDELWKENLQDTIVKEHSIGKFINNSIKNRDIVEYVIVDGQYQLDNPDTSESPVEEMIGDDDPKFEPIDL